LIDRDLPEAPVIAWTKFQKGAGYPVWSYTIRAGGLTSDEADAVMRETFRQIAKVEQYFKSNGYYAIIDGRDLPVRVGEVEERKGVQTAPRTTPQGPILPAIPGHPPLPPTQAPAPPPPQSPQVPSAPAQQQVQGGEQLIQAEFIKVTAPTGKPYIEFWRPNRRYPEISYKFGVDQFLSGPGTAMREAGWTAEHFAVGNEHTYPMNVYWTHSPKDERYKDIVRVEPR
jgi:hypothetical protein